MNRYRIGQYYYNYDVMTLCTYALVTKMYDKTIRLDSYRAFATAAAKSFQPWNFNNSL